MRMHEHDHVLVRRRHVADRERSADADREPAEHRAGNAPDAADDRGRERDEPDLEADVRIDVLEIEPVHHAASARERRAEEERDDDDPVDVDAHHRRGLEIERGGAHRAADLRPRHEVA